MAATKPIRIVKNVQQDGAWRFVTLARNGSRYEWIRGPAREGAPRRREVAGNTPSEALAARRRKQGGGILEEAEPQASPSRNEAPTAAPCTFRRPAGSVGVAHFPPDTVIQNRPVMQNPSRDRGVIDGQPSFGHHLLGIAIASGYRRYQRTQRAMMSSRKCRPRNNAGRFARIRISPNQKLQNRFATLRVMETALAYSGNILGPAIGNRARTIGAAATHE